MVKLTLRLMLILAILVSLATPGGALAGGGPTALAVAPVSSAGSLLDSPFHDMVGHWAADHVNRAADLRLVAGYPDGTFHPGSPVTRAEFLKMAVQVRSLTLRPGAAGFADVADHWLATQGYLQAAVDGGLVVPADFPGTGDGAAPHYDPDRPITRLDVAVIAARAMGKQGEAMALRGAPLPFAGTTPHWASGFVALAASAGILQGYPDGTFGGERTLTRAEAAVVALRLLYTVVGEGTVPAPAGFGPKPTRTVPVWEASSWNVTTLPLPPDPSLTPSDAMEMTTAPDGTLYLFADGQIFRIGPDGQATLVAEAPVAPTRNAIAADTAGNIYITRLNQVLRIAPDGAITPWAGSGQTAFADGVGTAAGFTGINGMCSDPKGNLYVTESGGRVRKIDSQGRVSTLAGRTPLQRGALWSPWSPGGPGPEEGPGYLVNLGSTLGPCAADSAGNVYIADSGIRRIGPDGTVSWFAGGGAYGGYADGLAAEAQFRTVSAMAADAWGNLWVADAGNQRIRRVTPDGRVYTVAGGGFDGYMQKFGFVNSYVGGNADGPGPDARLNGPVALALSGGKLYVAETGGLFADPNRAPGSTPRHLRVITGSTAAYPASKIAVPVAGAGMVPAAGLPGKAQQGPVTVAFGLYAPVEALRLQADGVAVASSGSEQPYTAGWDAIGAAPGSHELQVSIRLPDAGWAEGGRLPAEVLAETPPDVFPVHYALVTPTYGSWVQGTVRLVAAGDGGPLEFRVDGVTVARSTGRVLTAAWDSTTVADGEHKLELGHVVPDQEALWYDEVPLHVINHGAPPREDDLGPGLRAFLGGNRLAYKSASPRVVDGVPYLPFWETMDRAAVLMSRDGSVLTARKGERVTTLDVATGAVLVRDPRYPDHPYVLEHKPLQEQDAVLVPWDFVGDVLGMNGAWLREEQTVWWW